MSSQEETNISLELGDIIELIAPTNEAINDKQYLVKYIDSTKMELVNIEDGNVLNLNINDGNISDESITSIDLLDRATEPGYARQNNLIPNNWIDIHFDDSDIPTIVTGQITDIDNDMIEIKTYPDNKTIYLDFGYKGIPNNLPISKINIRDPPSQTLKPEVDPDMLASVPEESAIEAEEEEGTDVDVEVPIAQGDTEEEVKPMIDIKQQLKNMLMQAKTVELGQDLAEINQVVDVDESNRRFGIEHQTNDLLDEMLSTVPNNKRTKSLLNSIHSTIQRFKQLRHQFSDFDEYGNINTHVVKGSTHKPLVNTLTKLDQELYWLLPVVKNKRKLYNVESTESDEASDLLSLTLAETRVAEANIVDQYLSNNIPNGENKYEFLIKNLQPYFTPFTLPQSEDSELTTKRVNANITTVVDNQDDFFSSGAKNNIVKRQQYVLERYVEGLEKLKEVEIMKGVMATKVAELTPADTLCLKSILTLPEPAVRFSNVNLPNTSILDKCNYSMKFINYWLLLNKMTSVNNVSVSSDSEIDFTPETYLNEITNYVNEIEEVSMSDKYSNYLDSIVPKTKVLFQLFQKYIKNELSVYHVVSVLQPFMIYYDDLTFNQYNEMCQFIDERLIEYKKKFVTDQKNNNLLASYNYRNKTYMSPLLTLLRVTSEEEVLNAYKIIRSVVKAEHTRGMFLGSSEILAKFYSADGARLFMTNIAQSLINLNVNINFTKTLEDEKLNLAKDLDSGKSEDDCRKYVLAKKYVDIDDLESDNGNPIVYFDKKYDNTRYDIIKEYNKQMNSMPPAEFEPFLIKKLQNNIGMTEDDARREALAMIEGKRLVENGDYAVLSYFDEDNMNNTIYYKREDTNWVKDTSISEPFLSDVGDDNNIFCNTKVKCLQIKNDCVNDTTAIKEIEKKTIKNMLDEFEMQYSMSQQELKRLLTYEVSRQYNNLPKIMGIKYARKIMYSKKQYELGLNVVEKDITPSPYAELRDIILGQADFVKRQNDIIRFVNQFTRAAIDSEDQFWLYCPVTDTKLLPTYFNTLALAFNQQQNSSNYAEYSRQLEIVCAERGTISDDGDAIVDKYSGYFIRKIEFDTEEGYDESGYRLVSRERMEEDLGNTVLESTDKEKTYDNVDAQVTLSVIKAITGFIGIDIQPYHEFIIRNTLVVLDKGIANQKLYEQKAEQILKKTGKAQPKYIDAKHTLLIVACISYMLVAIQTSIPSVKTKKVFPGCVKSFTGYPMNGNSDKSGLIYLVCVTNKIKSSIEPWNSIKKVNEKSLFKKAEKMIDMYIVGDPLIQEKFKEKQAYALIEKAEEIPVEHDITTWVNFMPPLVQIRLKEITPVAANFEEDLRSNLRTGDPKQTKQLFSLQSKIMYYSLGIQQEIQRIMNTAEPLLTNVNKEPFLENACCNADDNVSSIAYFKHKSPLISEFNNTAELYANMLWDVTEMTKAPYFYSPLDTRNIYPPLPIAYSEETIYRAFIVYCKFNNNLPIDPELQRICMEKPSEFAVGSSVKEKIDQLKSQGKNFDENSLFELMKVINKNNIVQVNTDNKVVSPVQKLRQLLSKIDASEDESIVNSKFISLFINMLDRFELRQQSKEAEEDNTVREFKNFLMTSNDTLKTEIISFISKHSSIHKNKFAEIEKFIENVAQWSSVKTDNFVKSEDSTMFNVINFMQNIIRDTIDIFPNIIDNRVDYKAMKVPRHWKLSDRHESNVKSIIRNYYQPLLQFYDLPSLKDLLKNFPDVMKSYMKLSQETPLLADVLDSKDRLISIFEKDLVYNIFTYYFYNSLYQYIIYSNSDVFDLETQPIIMKSIEEEGTDDGLLSLLETREQAVGEISEVEIRRGDKSILQERVANLLISYIEIFINMKSHINYNYESIMERVLRSKEKEKDEITDFLHDLTDEEREIDNLFKKHKLERWSKGLQKGLTQYVKETYDEELAAIEKRIELEMKANKLSVVSEMNKDIFMGDLEMSERNNHEIEADEYSLAHLPEDDDYGENDGDQ